MAETIVHIQAAETQLLELVARARKGEYITIVRAGQPVARLGPAPYVGRRGPVNDGAPSISGERAAAESARRYIGL
jgi:prevent-host-death family protein